MNVTLVLLLTIIALLIIIIAIARVCRKLQKENLQYKDKFKKAKENMVYLLNHAEEIAEIQRKEKEVEAKINGAKTDEEILDIINTIVDTNNDRVRQ